MAKFIVKVIPVIEAEQFIPPNQIPRGVYDIRNVSKVADPIYIGRVLTIQGQEVTVHSGEWIVTESSDDTRHYPIDDLVFQKKYELLED